MNNGNFKVPLAKNEPVLSYKAGTPERIELEKQIKIFKNLEVDIPMYIGGEEIRTNKKTSIHPPHEIKHCLGYYHHGDESHIKQAIEAALQAKGKWQQISWEQRASIFLKAADLVAGPYRQKLNAATMLAQSKNAYQAEIDAACELADFLRFNVQYMTEIYSNQPESSNGMWNRLEYRPLEGFVYALSPFNFTSIAANLPTAPALMGNTVVWKPARTAVYSADILMQIFIEAGVPAGVINLINVPGPMAANVILEHRDFAGFHFTGSTQVFQQIWKTIGQNIEKYKAYPRIVGETGGKDYIFAHHTCDAKAVATAIVSGGFEYQGQKCSAASRIYIPASRWNEIRELIAMHMKSFKMGTPENFSNYINAVIDEASFNKLAGAIDEAKLSNEAEIIEGGNYDKSIGYFIEPTIILTTNPKYKTMVEELFGPIVTIYVYENNKLDKTIDLLDNTSMYALTGAIFAQDRYAIEKISEQLLNTAGNFYINDKPSGAVVGQQPFGGARGSGTNDKAGSYLNLLRWVSPRTIKERFVPAHDYKYPFLEE